MHTYEDEHINGNERKNAHTHIHKILYEFKWFDMDGEKTKTPEMECHRF